MIPSTCRPLAGGQGTRPGSARAAARPRGTHAERGPRSGPATVTGLPRCPNFAGSSLPPTMGSPFVPRATTPISGVSVTYRETSAP